MLAVQDYQIDNASENTAAYLNSTFSIVSKVAYLIGIPEEKFGGANLEKEWFDRLQDDKNARIVRNLCMLRTAIEVNFARITNEMQYGMKNLMSLPEYVPQSALRLRMQAI